MQRLSISMLVLLSTLAACADDGVSNDEVGAESTTGDSTGDTTETSTETSTSDTSTTETTDPTTETTDPTTDTSTETTTDPTTDTTSESSTDSSSSSDSTTGVDDDADDDGVVDMLDNCVMVPNPMQEDGDLDVVGDACDNCAATPNPDQGDLDMDLVGDWCDEEIIDDAILYIPAGAEVEMAGAHCYDEVRIYGSVTVTPWNGQTGGMLELTAAGAIYIADTGSINAAGAGRAGGAKSPVANTGGFGGDGPGRGCGGGNGNSVGQGGSGAGYGGSGGTPNNMWANGNVCPVCSQANLAHCEGTAGTAQGTQNGVDVDMGSGGGAGGNSSGCTNAGAPGAAGGGGVVLAANDAVVIDGWVSVAGAQPPTDNSNCGYRPGGGAGSGGAILIAADMVMGGMSALLDASGGAGGAALGEVNGQTWGWGGGGGGGGRVKIFGAQTFDGLIDVDGGAGGSAPATSQSFMGDAGTAGTVGGAEAVPAEYAGITCG